MPHLAIAGNIGSGKTTLAKKLAQHYGYNLFLEEVDNNPFLEDFYADMPRWSFHLQMFFLHSRFRQARDILTSSKGAVQDRTIYEDAHIFAKNLFESGLMSPREYASYKEMFDSMLPFTAIPDLMIYLRADLATLVRHIHKRGRAYEHSIRIDYLEKLNEHYEEWIGQYNDGKLLVIDVNNMDFEANTEDFGAIVQRIDAQLHGLFS